MTEVAGHLDLERHLSGQAGGMQQMSSYESSLILVSVGRGGGRRRTDWSKDQDRDCKS